MNRDLVESQLFGHEKGAFTGAQKARKGAFEEANGGTIFLDEVGDLAMELQSKLLRVIESGEITRVGTSKPTYVNARVVAATNKDLKAQVKLGLFREDLYYRLGVIPIEIPPLRTRGDDLRILIDHFLNILAKNPITLSLPARRKLIEYYWPGNVRQLLNSINRSLLLRKKDQLDADDIFLDCNIEKSNEVMLGDPLADDLERIYLRGKTLSQIEDEVTRKTFHRLEGDRVQLMEALGQSRATVYNRIKKLGLCADDEQ